MDLCEKCAPLANQMEKDIEAKVRKSFQDELQKYAEVTKEKNDLKVAAAEAEKKADGIAKERDELKAKLDKVEKDQKEAIAAAAVEKEFAARKDRYPADKHGEVKAILSRLQMGQSTAQDAMNLADWQVQPDKSKGKETGDTKETKLSLAGANDNEPGEYTPWTQEQIDARLLKRGALRPQDIPGKGAK